MVTFVYKYTLETSSVALYNSLAPMLLILLIPQLQWHFTTLPKVGPNTDMVHRPIKAAFGPPPEEVECRFSVAYEVLG